MIAPAISGVVPRINSPASASVRIKRSCRPSWSTSSAASRLTPALSGVFLFAQADHVANGASASEGGAPAGQTGSARTPSSSSNRSREPMVSFRWHCGQTLARRVFCTGCTSSGN